MYLSHKKEQFQIGYIKALTAHAGLNTGSWAVDNNSIDIMLKGSGFSDSPIMNPSMPDKKTKHQLT